LRAVANTAENAGSAAARDKLDEAAIIDALEALEELPPGVATALAKLLDKETPVPLRIELLNALTDDVVGRYAAAEGSGDRAEQRLGDARAAVTEFDHRLTSANETDLQDFLEANPWIL